MNLNYVFFYGHPYTVLYNCTKYRAKFVLIKINKEINIIILENKMFPKS